MKKEKIPHASNEAIEKYKKRRIEVFAYTSGITLAIVAILGGIGYWLDLKLGTGHRYLIIGVLIAYPVTQYYLYRKFKSNQ